MKRLALQLMVAVGAWFVCGIPSASAGEPRTHDGFFLRLSAGAGSAHSTIHRSGTSDRISGDGSGDANLAVGGMVARNLALHGTLMGWYIQDPDLEHTVTGVANLTTRLAGDADLSGFGGGLTYYFMPVNVYVTGSIGTGQLTIPVNTNVDTTSDYGLMYDLGAGKEWWVGKSWGLGFNVGYSHHSVPESGSSEHWSGDAFAIRFSATLN